MARIAGENIPDKKRLCIALTYIYGIGYPTGLKICKTLGINENKKVSDLTRDEIDVISSYINHNLLVSSDLRREVSRHIQHLKNIGTFMGRWHRAHDRTSKVF